MKTVVMVLPTFGGGGAESVMITIANELSHQHSVHFIVGTKNGEFKDKLSDGVTVYDLNVTKFSKAIFPIRSILKKINPDTIFSTLIYCNIITYLGFKLSGIKGKLVLREATTPSKELVQQNFIFKYLFRKAYYRANQIIAVSEGVKNDLVQTLKVKNKNISIIPNPIVGDHIFELAESNQGAEHFIKDTIVTVGKVTEAKDYYTLLKAFNIVKEKHDCQLIIVGNYFQDSDLYKNLKAYIDKNNLQDSILFVGFQKNPFSFMKKAKVFVLSSIYEGSPGALVQGLAINGNVVSTDCESGPREILENGKYGKLVAVRDYKAMALALQEALLHPVDHRNSPSLTNFTIQNSVQKYADVLFNDKL